MESCLVAGKWVGRAEDVQMAHADRFEDMDLNEALMVSRAKQEVAIVIL